MARLRIGDLLVQVGLIDEAQLKSALAMQRQYGGRLGNILVDNGFLDEMMLWRGLSKQLGLQLVSLPDIEVTPQMLQALPKEFAMQHDVFPAHVTDREITVATSDPGDIGVLDDLRARLGLRVRTVLAPAREISWAIGFHYQGMRHPCPPPRTKGTGSGLDVKTGNDPVSQGQTAPRPAPPPVPMTNPPMPVTTPPVPNTQNPSGGYRMPAQAAPVPQGAPAPHSGAYTPPAGYPTQPPGTIPPTGASPSGAYPQPAMNSNDAAAHIARLEATLAETNAVLRYLVDACVSRGVFSRDEFLERMRRLQSGG